MPDHHLASAMATLGTTFETVKHIPKVNTKTKEIEDEQKKVELLHRILSQFDADTKGPNGSNRIDYRNDEEKKALIDQAREFFPTLFPHGDYAWNDKALQRLMTNIDNTIAQVISPRISQLTAEQTQNFYEHNEIMEILMTILKDCRDLIRHIQSNIAKA